MKCSPFPSVNSVTFFSNSLRSCAGRRATHNISRALGRSALTVFLPLLYSYENSRAVAVQPSPWMLSEVDLGPRVPSKYLYDCCYIRRLLIMDSCPQGSEKTAMDSTTGWDERLKEIEGIADNRRGDRRYEIHLALRWKLIRRRRVLDTGVGHTLDLD